MTQFYTFVSDPGHGWLMVPLALIAREEYSRFSYTDGEFAYLEEDVDMGRFMARHNVSLDDIVLTRYHDTREEFLAGKWGLYEHTRRRPV